MTRRSAVWPELRQLASTVALLLVAEVVLRSSGWSRRWVYAAALAVSFPVRSAVRAARRARTRSGPAAL